MNIDSIMDEIKAGLSGNLEEDLNYLRLQIMKYMDTEYCEDVLKNCGQLMIQICPKDAFKKRRTYILQ